MSLEGGTELNQSGYILVARPKDIKTKNEVASKICLFGNEESLNGSEREGGDAHELAREVLIC